MTAPLPLALEAKLLKELREARAVIEEQDREIVRLQAERDMFAELLAYEQAAGGSCF